MHDSQDPALRALRNAQQNYRHRARRLGATSAGPPNNRWGRLTTLQEVISHLSPKLLPDLPVLALASWDRIVGSVASHVRPASFDEDSKVLTVQTNSKAWATQMNLLAPRLVTRLQEEGIPVQLIRVNVTVNQLPQAPLCTPLSPSPTAPRRFLPPKPQADPAVVAALARQDQTTTFGTPTPPTTPDPDGAGASGPDGLAVVTLKAAATAHTTNAGDHAERPLTNNGLQGEQ